MKNTSRQLRRELLQAGAKASEADELSAIASRLRMLADDKYTFGKIWARAWKPVGLTASAFAVGVVLVISAQSVAPTSLLYPVQKISDAVAVRLHPSYRATVMMRRAQQVNQLVASHAPSEVILATLASYQTEAMNYKAMPHADYATFDFCKTNLEQAAAAAPGNVRQAIVSSLEELRNT